MDVFSTLFQCYVNSFPCFNINNNCSFDCLFNPNNRDHVIERRRFTKADVINALFWPSLATLVSLVYFILLSVIQNVKYVVFIYFHFIQNSPKSGSGPRCRFFHWPRHSTVKIFVPLTPTLLLFNTPRG